MRYSVTSCFYLHQKNINLLQAGLDVSDKFVQIFEMTNKAIYMYYCNSWCNINVIKDLKSIEGN